MPEIEQLPAEGAKSVGSGLGHKLGPLPVWGWIVIAGVGVVGYLYLKNAGGGSVGAGVSGALPPGTPFTGGNGTPATTTSTPATTTTVTPMSNTTWLQTVASQVAKQLQLPESEVRLYLGEYLNGGQPSGSSQATSLFTKVIDAANTIMAAPNPPTGGQPGNSPYGSQASWWNDIQNFLPSGTSHSILSELQALFSGTTSSLSTDASNALSAAESVVGTGPNPLSWTITGPVVGTLPPSTPPSPQPPIIPPITIPPIIPPITIPPIIPPITIPPAPKVYTWLSGFNTAFLALGSDFYKRVAFFQTNLGLNATQSGDLAQRVHMNGMLGLNLPMQQLLDQTIAGLPMLSKPKVVSRKIV
jgi:hypothetical protein